MDLIIAKAMMMITIILNHLTRALLTKGMTHRKKERINTNLPAGLENESVGDTKTNKKK